MLYSPAFFLMAAANLLSQASYTAFYLFPIFIKRHGGAEIDIGIIMGVSTLASVLFRPWISGMIDRMGRKRSYTVGSLLLCAMPLIYLTFTGDLPSFYYPSLAVRIIHGVGFAICLMASFTFIVDLAPPWRLNEGIGVFGVSGLVGSAAGPAVGELIINRLGFDALFIASAVMALACFILHLPLRETYVRVEKAASPSFFVVLKEHKVLNIGLVSLAFGFGLSASNNFVSPYASISNVSFISIYFIAYSVAAIITRFFGSRLADGRGEDKIIPPSLVLTGIGLGSLMFLSGTGMLCFSGFVTGVGHGLLYPALYARAIRGQPIDVRGKITGVFTGSIDGGVFVGSIALGFLGDLAGYRAIFLAAGLALIVGLWIFLAGFRREPQTT